MQRGLYTSYCKRLDKGEVPLWAMRAIAQTRGGIILVTTPLFLMVRVHNGRTGEMVLLAIEFCEMRRQPRFRMLVDVAMRLVDPIT